MAQTMSNLGSPNLPRMPPAPTPRVVGSAACHHGPVAAASLLYDDDEVEEGGASMWRNPRQGREPCGEVERQILHDSREIWNGTVELASVTPFVDRACDCLPTYTTAARACGLYCPSKAPRVLLLTRTISDEALFKKRRYVTSSLEDSEGTLQAGGVAPTRH